MLRSINIPPADAVTLFVKNIMVLEDDAPARTMLPFFADGFPGIMFQQTKNGLYISPHNKSMPILFLYGQTIQPVELIIDGTGIKQNAQHYRKNF